MEVTTSTFENIVTRERARSHNITLNRPKVLNALNQATLANWGWLSRTPAQIPQCGVILTGAGDKAFIAGRTSASWLA